MIGRFEALVRGLEAEQAEAGRVDDDPIVRPDRTIDLP